MRLGPLSSWKRLRGAGTSFRYSQNDAGLETTGEVRRFVRWGYESPNGLFDGILIKDNHLASRAVKAGVVLDAGEAVRQAYQFVNGLPQDGERPVVEIEIDSIDQLASALDAGPDIVLLDNMNCDQLSACVQMRDRLNPKVELEASGGVNLNTITAIAATGVERISVGALTHSAVNLDLGLDWRFG